MLSELAEWDTFYVIVGSSAGALIGLQFVVMTLIAERPPLRVAEASAAFASPTVVHFSAVLLLAALLRAPWQSIAIVAAAWGVIGVGGVAYQVIVHRRMRRQAAYEPQFEDWLFHIVLPLAAYGILALSPIAATSYTREALFAVGAAALLLLFIGIHNAWDGVAYMVIVRARNRQDGSSVFETRSQHEGTSTAGFQKMDIRRSGSQPSAKGPIQHFTGPVRIDPLFEAHDPARALGVGVAFEPGARTAWHTHPLGQILIVTAGRGRVQSWGGPIEEIRPGDVVWIPPGEKHWHGAAATTAMTHIAIQEELDGKTVDFMEPVSDEQYR